MKKVMFLMLVIMFAAICPCLATDHYAEDLLSLMKLSHETATQEQVTSLLGEPARTEDGKKRLVWYYEKANTTLVISWNKKSQQLEKFSFSNKVVENNTFDLRTSKRLQSGVTNIVDAIKILGTPKDMTIKGMTQEMHYAYQHNVLRLFFRNKMLVDYTLY